jgi:ABC-type transport system involved in multi-copper enzyme maturation permease subunit
MSYPVPSAATALGTLARVTFQRTLRRRALWGTLAVILLPTLFASSMKGHSILGNVDDTFNVVRLLLAIIPPVLVAAAIGEEIEDRTATYLWSRPLARWTVVVGKLLALAPIAMAALCASWAIAAISVFGGSYLVQGAVPLAAGALAVSIASAGIATLVPKHGMALTIIYVLADLMIGALPTSLAKLCMTYHVEVLASRHSSGEDVLQSALGLAAISAIWLAIGLRRIRRLEV